MDNENKLILELCKGKFANKQVLNELMKKRLDYPYILGQLRKYLSSTISDYPLDNPEVVWGIVVYDFLCMYLDKLADGSIPHERRDRRVFRLVWEHKKCMLGRMKAVEEKCKWDSSLSAAYNEGVALADKMRFIYSKFVIKYSSKHLENIQICLMKMKELEIKLLNVFAEKLLTELDDEKDS